MKTIIETDRDSIVLLSRESYDMIRAMQTASNLRNTELAKMRDKFEARVLKDNEIVTAHGYTKYYTAAEVLALFRDIFEIEPHEPAKAPASCGGEDDNAEDNTKEGE